MMTNSNLQPRDFPDGLMMVAAPASDHAAGLDLEGLAQYLSERMGIAVNFKKCDNYDEAIKALTGGTAQLGWLGPSAYAEAAHDGDIEAFAVGLPRGKSTPNYQSVFITRPDGLVQNIKDVKKTRIAIGDPHSTSGYVVPRQILAGFGIHLDNETDFKEIIHASTHDEAIRMVRDRRADVAAVSSVNLEENIDKGELSASKVRVIYRSQDISGAPLVYSLKLAEATRALLKDLVLDAHNHVEIGGYGGAMEKYVDPSEGRLRLLESYLRPQWGWRTQLTLASFVALTAAIMIDLDVNLLELIKSTSAYMLDVIYRMMPPDFTNLGELLRAMLETIEIAFLGTLLAIVLSIPIGLFSARNMAPNYLVYAMCRTITIFFRAVPEFIMAMILVIAIGFGAMPGIIALGFHTMGFLAKFYAEAIEQVRVGPMDALSSMGASRSQIQAFAVVPQIMPSFIGNNLYILDRNIRMATMLGIVGAGGIGYELQSSFRMFEYQRVSAIII
ncbi:MAG: phosphonate ABC transporter, permease protein PhnE, partial [Rhodospirillales bacterium]|nr:phosphonate ABC transporter, permease protein PhnE [Rhodospirillales bacterium]